MRADERVVGETDVETVRVVKSSRSKRDRSGNEVEEVGVGTLEVRKALRRGVVRQHARGEGRRL